MSLTEAIIDKYGFKSGLTLQGNKIIEWPYKQPKPSESELNILHENFKESNKYKELRKNMYPPIEEQLDTLYHFGYEGWKTSISKIKKKYPKTTGIRPKLTKFEVK